MRDRTSVANMASGRATSIRKIESSKPLGDNRTQLGRKDQQAQGQKHDDLHQPGQTIVEALDARLWMNVWLPRTNPARYTARKPLPPSTDVTP